MFSNKMKGSCHETKQSLNLKGMCIDPITIGGSINGPVKALVKGAKFS